MEARRELAASAADGATVPGSWAFVTIVLVAALVPALWLYFSTREHRLFLREPRRNAWRQRPGGFPVVPK